MNSSTEKRNQTRKGARRGWLILLPVLLMLAALAWWLNGVYFFAGGHLYRRDALSLDIRGRNVDTRTYTKIRENLPEAEILWDVPLSCGAADCTAENLVLTGLEDEDLSLFGNFTSLRSIDAVEAALTPEQFEALSAALPGCRIRWSIPIGGGRYPSDAQNISLGALSEAEIPLFRYFEDLHSVSAAECTDYPAIMALREANPELDVSWQVSLSGQNYAQDARELVVDDPAATAAQLGEALRYLPAVETVQAPDVSWSESDKDALMDAWPEVRFLWPVEFRGTVYGTDVKMLDLSGRPITAAEVDELVKKGPSLSGVEQIDLSGSGISLADAKRLKEAMPRADLLFDFELYGVKINSMDSFIDFSNIEMDSVDEVESLIPLMPKLEKIDMSFCGLDNETLDAFNKRYDDVRVVWTMRIVYWSVRTDAKAFRASSRYYSYFTEETIHWFKYCPDLICMDMGHRNLSDLSFLYDVPQLEYLILLRWKATDLTPIGSLKHLKWLELNGMDFAESLAPLKGCTSLTDLNITCMNTLSTNEAAKEETYETILAMPALERLWFCGELTLDQENKLREARPDLMLVRVPGWELSTMNPWRFDEDYYAMRDLMDLFYMDQGGRVNFKIIDGVRYDLDPEFIAQQGDNSMDKVRACQ